ncbi:hypothetical protein, partial [Pseudomonas savastanoi]|uniref:hypothetical protein n=1 Tax=Pseudomonas savastanoi TaxID=29438 RepID=UPI001C805FA1
YRIAKIGALLLIRNTHFRCTVVNEEWSIPLHCQTRRTANLAHCCLSRSYFFKDLKACKDGVLTVRARHY